MSVSDPRQPACGGPSGPAPFGTLLRELRSRAGLSQNALARRAEIDPAYVNRLERGGEQRPSRAVVLALARECGCNPAARDTLLAAGGHCPEAVRRLGGWDPTLAAVAQLLAGPTESAVRRAITHLSATNQAGPTPASADPTSGSLGSRPMLAGEGGDV